MGNVSEASRFALLGRSKARRFAYIAHFERNDITIMRDGSLGPKALTGLQGRPSFALTVLCLTYGQYLGLAPQAFIRSRLRRLGRRPSRIQPVGEASPLCIFQALCKPRRFAYLLDC
jgi:hypothetical protein